MAIEYKTLVQEVRESLFKKPPYETGEIISRQAANGWELFSITPLTFTNAWDGSTSHLLLVFKKTS